MIPFPSGATWRVALILAFAALASYVNTFSAPFIFDDAVTVPGSAALRGMGQLTAYPGSGAAGRPLVILSLALNHAMSGQAVWSYHAFNLLVHLGAGLALYGVVARTIADRRIALATALLWLLHPLQTESVTCVIQRTESLAGLFFLLTIYGWIRGWRWVALGACLLGAATKELLAVAPVLLLLFDRTFQAGSFRGAWQQRGRWHVAMAATTWSLVGLLVWQSGMRGGNVGFGRGIAWWEYGLTQLQAIALYLKLAVWPHPLVLDYGTAVVRDFAAVWPQALLLSALAGLAAWALWRRPVAGFLGAWFFAILAPSSSVVPLVTQTMSEHRMYLPLAAIVVLGVVAWQRIAGRAFWIGIGLAALAFGGLTFARNQTYRSAEDIWRDNLAKAPGNARALHNLAQLADRAGRHDEAIAHGEAALKIQPDEPTVHFNLGFSLEKAGRIGDAVAHYREAVRLRPEFVDPHVNLGAILLQLRRIDEAVTEFETVARLRPDSAKEQFNLGQAYAAAGRLPEAIGRYEAALRLEPGHAEIFRRLGNAWARQRGYQEAEAAYRAALRIEPHSFDGQVGLAAALVPLGRLAEAAACYEAALKIKPDAQVEKALAQLRARIN